MLFGMKNRGRRASKQDLKISTSFCSVLFCSVLFCSVLFCSVLFCSVLFLGGFSFPVFPDKFWLGHGFPDFFAW